MEWTVNSLRDLDCGFSGNISKIARDFGKQIQKRLFTLMTDYKLTLFFFSQAVVTALFQSQWKMH